MQTAQRSAKRIQLTPLKTFIQRDSRVSHIVVHTIDFIELLKPDEIIYVKADSNYCVFVLSDGTQCMSSKTLGSYEQMLRQHGFVRPHKTFIVNVHAVRRIRKVPVCALCMQDGSEIPVARARRKEMLDHFAGPA